MSAESPEPDASRSIMRYSDLGYREPSGCPPLRLDVAVPAAAADANSLSPVVVFAHGGAFRTGDRTMFSRPLFELDPFGWLPSHGIAFASVDYRLSWQARWPACVEDVLAALDWIVHHASDLRIDPTRLATWGESAGGYLAVMCGLQYAHRSVAVRGIVDWYAPINFATMAQQGATTTDDPGSPESELLGAPVQSVPELAARANPCALVQTDSPPALIMHGTADKSVPYQQSEELAHAYRSVGAAVRLVPVAGAGHLFRGARTDQLMPTVLEFLRDVLKPERDPSAGSSDASAHGVVLQAGGDDT